MLVLGIDGCRDGWLVVALRGGAFCSASFAPTVAEALEAHQAARVVAIDIPIGSEAKRFRSVDAEAKKRLGSRASTIFETPPLEVLREPDFASAVSLCRKLAGKGLSQQSYALRTKILEVAPLADRDDRIIEVHPELSFSVLAGSAVPASKKSWGGLMRRKLLLEQAGIRLPESLGESAGRVAPDDVLDAAVAAWTAERKRCGLADHVGAAAERGGRRSPTIWF